jgi:protein required for attachment to host cells
VANNRKLLSLQSPCRSTNLSRERFSNREQGHQAVSDLLKVPHDALLLVSDGKKALFLRNEGDALSRHLVVERVLETENPATRLQGSDRPGRVFGRAGSHRRSGVQTTDRHRFEKNRFAHEVAQALGEHTKTTDVPEIILIAPARTLAELRDQLDKDTTALVTAQIEKDLTKHPIPDIERELTLLLS